uniref:Protein kinase-like domain-containing protein n=1 Tax=Tanacetum cinerariifolium TaxID=118510 RepID=A0A6L2JM77_TANCI|nr:protein kinase-like domain-containing protein [Tanacetum cinerariifolium]
MLLLDPGLHMPSDRISPFCQLGKGAGAHGVCGRDLELPVLLGRPFLRICGAIIDMRRGTLCIDNRDEDGNVKYGSVAPSFRDIENDMERALATEAYFNPFKHVIVFKKLADFLGLLPVQLKNLDCGNEGYRSYKKVDGVGDWHARFQIVTPSERKVNQAFKTKTTTRKLSGMFIIEDVLRSLIKILIEVRKFENAMEALARRQTGCVGRPGGSVPERSFGVPRVANWRLFEGYGFEDTLREMMKLEYIYERDGDVFVDYSWERALLIDNEIYPKWALEFFSTLYFDKDVDRNKLMKEKDEIKHHLFEVYFGWLEVDDKQFDYKDYWTRVGKPTLSNHKEVLVKEPLMQIVLKVIVGSLVHRVASRERCQKRDLWMMSSLEMSRGVNLTWIIMNHLYKHAPRTKENSVICVGHYVTKIACFLGYCVDDLILYASNGGNETNYHALLSFKSKITHDPYNVLTSWNYSFHLCEWSDISYGKRRKRVTVLRLYSEGIEGLLSPHVGNLSFFRKLSLRGNSFQGTIPHELGPLSLCQNKLAGSIPNELSLLSKLFAIGINNNKLTGGIPPFLGNITLMEVFSASKNPLGLESKVMRKSVFVIEIDAWLRGELTLSSLDMLQGLSFFLQMGFALILATIDGLDVGLLGDVIGKNDCDDDG